MQEKGALFWQCRLMESILSCKFSTRQASYKISHSSTRHKYNNSSTMESKKTKKQKAKQQNKMVKKKQVSQDKLVHQSERKHEANKSAKPNSVNQTATEGAMVKPQHIFSFGPSHSDIFRYRLILRDATMSFWFENLLSKKQWWVHCSCTLTSNWLLMHWLWLLLFRKSDNLSLQDIENAGEVIPRAKIVDYFTVWSSSGIMICVLLILSMSVFHSAFVMRLSVHWRILRLRNQIDTCRL